MDTRIHDTRLELSVLRALSRLPARVTLHVVVTATPDASVYLRGCVTEHADLLLLRDAVAHVPGVRQVFCNVATGC